MWRHGEAEMAGAAPKIEDLCSGLAAEMLRCGNQIYTLRVNGAVEIGLGSASKLLFYFFLMGRDE